MEFNCLKATESLRDDSSLFTTKFPGVLDTHLTNLGRMKDWMEPPCGFEHGFLIISKKRCGLIDCWRSISMIIQSMHFNYHISISLGIMVLVKVNAKSDLIVNLLSTMHVYTSRNMVARTPWTYLYVTALINWDIRV